MAEARSARAASNNLCFFSSRRRHTRYWRDWSSDVCSSDLDRPVERGANRAERPLRVGEVQHERRYHQEHDHYRRPVEPSGLRRLPLGHTRHDVGRALQVEAPRRTRAHRVLLLPNPVANRPVYGAPNPLRAIRRYVSSCSLDSVRASIAASTHSSASAPAEATTPAAKAPSTNGASTSRTFSFVSEDSISKTVSAERTADPRSMKTSTSWPPKPSTQPCIS